ncbi:hypothetical protein DMENIID0001_005020 [Sergentomyia squamirostris]
MFLGPSCQKHEEYLFCGEAPPCQTTCENLGKACDVKTSAYCPQGCYCKNGYARHPITNQCIHVKSCPAIEYVPQKPPTTIKTTTTTTTTTTTESPKICGRYEVYDNCGSPCQIECSNLGEDCPIKNIKCTSGCYCKPGYARDGPGGPCIPQKTCPKPYCPKNEIWLPCGQAPDCQETCDGYDPECEARKKIGICPSGCYCRKGYARHPTTGECIRKRDCPTEPQCSVNEEYKDCGYRCKEKCFWKSKDCYDDQCESGCFCSEGYVRINGNCVPKDKCVKKCPANEEYLKCGKHCSEDCSYPDSCAHDSCDEGCFCINGYKRVAGVCVPASNCPPPKCSQPNEVYKTCGKSCDEDCTKSSDDCRYEVCQEGCYCDKGFKRVRGRCVPEENCVCPTNEEYKCGTDCNEDCNTQLKDCWNKKCTTKCHCVGNYKRIDGVCQPPSKCSCPANEVYSYGNKCSEQCGKTLDDCSSQKLYFSCFCQSGFKRVGGVCVPDTNCQCPLNEEYTYNSKCAEKCESGPDDCKNEKCYKGCFCKDGFRRINNQCVPDDQCSCGRNEEYSYGNECLDDCTTTPDDCKAFDTYKRCNCKPGFKRIYGKCVPDSKCKCGTNESYKYGSHCNEQCNNGTIDCSQEECFKGCFCDEGYVRIDGSCVLGDDCGCGENEDYYNSNTCFEDCSKNVDDCLAISTSYGCYCIRNYKRINDLCVPESNCPCPPNEEFGWLPYCRDQCDYDPEVCNSMTVVDGCHCKPGYKRISGVCVKDYLCPCPANEEYKYGDRCLEQCQENYDDCPPGSTVEGCYCKDGFVRVNGTCQTFDNCECGDEHEIYAYSNDCLESCEGNPDNCKDLPLTAACYCAPNYVRDNNGNCVPDSTCPCGSNESYKSSNSCNEQCKDSTIDCSQEECFKGCFCDDGYIRINGTCVTGDNCACGENEEYYNRNTCFEDCSKTVDECTKLPNVYGCYCIRNYKRINGLCVLDSNCPCPPNEEFGWTEDCREQCDYDPEVCDPMNQANRCKCKPGYKRILGVCVPQNLCPCPDNEEFKYGDRCEELCQDNYDDCPPEETVEGCYCKDGYVRVNGTCQTFSNCQCEDDNEIYIYYNSCLESCEGNYETCKDLPLIAACYCAPDFVRDNNGNCVPDTECPCSDVNAEYKPGKPCEDSCIPSEDCSDLICYKACYCKDGFKNIDGTCQPDSECTCDGENEEYQVSNTCLDTCDGNPDSCTGIPTKNGCYCISGYRRNSTGSCVPDTECPCSDVNAEYKSGKPCEDACIPSEDCSNLVCYKACYCKDGFKLVEGECVPQVACCDEPEVFKYSNECLDQCAGNRNICAGQPVTLGCYCPPGLRRDASGTCVPDTQCKCEDTNAEYKSGPLCEYECEPPPNCATQECYKGCFCKDGFKLIAGQCVPEATCCADPEVYIYSNDCLDQCTGNPDTCAGQPVTLGCYCKPGFRRDAGGTCVPDTDCTCEDTNAEYKSGPPCEYECEPAPNCATQECYKGCFCKDGFKLVEGQCVPEATCCADPEVYIYSNDCLDQCTGNPDTCAGQPVTLGCYCKPGFRRDAGGTCVPDTDCTCEDTNAEYKSGPPCEYECEPAPNCATQECYKGCFCKDGFKLVEGQCVPEATCCADPEVYIYSNDCLDQCNGNPDICAGQPVTLGCYCKPGFRRDAGGTCVPDTDCTCEDTNAEYKSGPPCEYECEPAPNCATQECYKGCFCKDGFKLVEGQCVPEATCCADPEVYIYSNDCLDQCTGNPDICAGQPVTLGCYCKPGFRRDAGGTCVPDTDCTCEDTNAEYKFGPPCEYECEPAPNCATQECYKGCFCKDGFKLVEGQCVPEATCCADPEVYIYSNDCLDQCTGNPDTCAGQPVTLGCYCKPGFRRDAGGTCVPDTDCTCEDTNAEYKSGPPCEYECEPVPNCATQECYKGCFCKDGFKLVEGQCVPEATCCADPEVYIYSNDCLDQCTGNPDTCAGQPVTLGCYCKPGFRRDAGGTCVPDTDCTCEDTNAEYKSGPPCEYECEPPPNCATEECYKGCFCKDGFKLVEGQCVPEATCCADPEVYIYSNDCLDQCTGNPDTCAGQPVTLGCYCKPGFRRDAGGTCVPDTDCTCEDTNAEYKSGPPCEYECEPAPNCATQECYKGCFCKDGFKLVEGQCVPEATCCADPEVYIYSNDCLDQCTGNPDTCAGQPVTLGCYCKPGFRRDAGGTCVPDTDCTCEDTNAEYKFGPPCEYECEPAPNCATQECYKGCFCKDGFKLVEGQCVPEATCCADPEVYIYSNDCLDQCTGNPDTCAGQPLTFGCYCKPGFRRDAGGTCVPDTDCTCEDTNAEYKSGPPCEYECEPAPNCATQECYKGCFCKDGFKLVEGQCVPEATCCADPEVYIYSNDCLDQCTGNPDTCAGQAVTLGCYCKPGFRRDAGGTCVPDTDCTCEDTNAEYRPGPPCEYECEPAPNCATQECYKGCFCKDGFKLVEGQCVPEATCCADPEVYIYSNDCLNQCTGNPDTCAGQPVTLGCYCKPGFRRDAGGTCVPDTDCTCEDTNAEYKSGPPCEYECEPAPNCATQECYKGCFCKDGFKLVEGQCVPEATCCADPEVYIYSNDCLDQCTGNPDTCAGQPLTFGCYCKPGFRRDAGGTCVPDTDCTCEDTNAEYKSGPPCEYECEPAPNCASQECYKGCFCKDGFKLVEGQCVPEATCCADPEVYIYSNDCLDQCTGNPDTCAGQPVTLGCYCKPGFRRDAGGTCVPDTDCTCEDTNAEYKSGPPCEYECEPAPNCATQECYKGCFCKDGFKLVEGQCVPEATCCADPEVYIYSNDCLDQCTGNPDTCAGQPVTLGCYCKPGFRRDAGGTCVPDTDCTCEDTNAEYKSGPPCEYECEPAPNCATQECYKGCFCKDGFKLVEGQCVPEATCCADPEVYTSSNDCLDQCTGNPETCAGQPLTFGCYCKPGFRRDAGGTCVPDTDCTCEDTNAEYKSGPPCEYECEPAPNCATQECYKGCFCKDGFKLVEGQCVPEATCCADPEVYIYSNDCLDQCTGNPDTCAGQPLTFGCYCKPGFRRDAGGTCVPDTDCTCEDTNAEYRPGPPCEYECEPAPNCATQECYKGCFCKDGFKLVEGQCVPEATCCADPEVYIYSNDCLDQCTGNPDTCAGQPVTLGCYCKPGFRRDAGGTCVPDTDCTCEDTNAEYKSGPPCEYECEPPPNCATEECYKGCFCKVGFKLVEGQCVPEATCCADPEVYIYSNDCLDQCTGNPDTCAGQPLTFGCYCKPGFRRDAGGTCVPDTDCTCEDTNAEYKSGPPCEYECEPAPNCATQECYKGCFCKDGFKLVEGQCVPEATCCADPEVYIYSNDCLDQCTGNPDSCAGRPVTLGCYCKPGFKRDAGGTCVPDTDCTCEDTNAEYKSGPPCEYECEPAPNCATQLCYKGCFCKNGFKLVGGSCQPESQCTCTDPNAVYKSGKRCEEECQVTNACEAELCVEACLCKQGFKRINGICVPSSQCPNICGPNEEYRCGQICDERCDLLDISLCLSQPCTYNCYCKPGQKRQNGQCIPPSECTCSENAGVRTDKLCSEDCMKSEAECLIDLEIPSTKCFCNPGFCRSTVDNSCVPRSPSGRKPQIPARLPIQVKPQPYVQKKPQPAQNKPQTTQKRPPFEQNKPVKLEKLLW